MTVRWCSPAAIAGRTKTGSREALERVVAGGLIVVAGSKDDGIASLRKRIGKLVDLGGHLPKYHGVVFWFQRPADASEAVRTLQSLPGSHRRAFRHRAGHVLA